MRTERKRANLPLRLRVLLAVWGGLAAFFTGIAALESVALNRSVALLLEERVHLARVTAFHIDEVLQDGVRHLQAAASDVPTPPLAGDAAGSLIRAKGLLDRFIETHSEFDRVFLTDARGTIVAEAGKVGPTTPSAVPGARPAGALATLPEMEQALASGKPALGFHPADPSGAFPHPVILFLVPLDRPEGHLRGVLGGEMEMVTPPFASLMAQLQAMAPGGDVLIINEAGTVIGGTNAAERFTPFEHWRDVEPKIHAGNPFFAISRAANGKVQDSLAMAPLKITPWWVTLEQPESELLAPVRRLGLWFWVGFVAALLLSTAFAYFATGWVLWPVQRIAGVARRVEGGDFSTPFTPEAGPEMGTLSRQLEAARLKMVGWTHELEEKVAERTAVLTAEIAERKRAEEETEKRRRELAVLYAIDRAAAQSLGLQEVLDRALEATVKALEMDMGGILLLEEGGEALELRAHRGVPPDFMEVIRRVRIGEGAAGRAALERRPVVLGVEEYRSDRIAPHVQRIGLQTMASTPLVSRGELVGALSLGAFRHREFLPQELALLTSIGQQLGSAVQNALLYEAARQELAERKHAENALRESENRFRTITEAALAGVYIFQDGKFRYVNSALASIFGYAPEEIVSHFGPLDLTHPDDHALVTESVRRRISGETESAQYTFRGVRKDGSIIHCEVLGRRIEYEGRPAIVGTLLDITERKKLEEELRQSQKIEAVGELAGGVAHDFNNLLNVITGFTELARDGLAAEDPARPHLDRVSTAAFRAAELTHKLLAFSRRQILQRDLVNMSDVVDEFSKMLTRIVGEDIEVRIVKVPQLLLVKADAGQMEQVLLNLCTNARQAMPQGGQLIIETRSAVLDDDFVTAHPWARAGRFVQLTVTDTGVGMTPEVRARIFEPFFTTRPEGTGLGLAMVYGIVKQHDGFVSVYSEPGRGTTFHLYLPQTEGAPQKRPVEAPPPATRGVETLLVAEDEPLLRELVATCLSALGYTVLTAADGEVAVRQLQARRDEIALVVLDVVMPRLSGYEAYLQMQALRTGLKVIFITGYAPVAGPLAGLIEQKGVTLLQKPFSPSALAAKIRELLDAK